MTVRALLAGVFLSVLWLPPCVLAFDLQGHRGARGLAPENTLAAFRRALAIGVTTLETDLAVTRDGVLVLSHDPMNTNVVDESGASPWHAGLRPADHGSLPSLVKAAGCEIWSMFWRNLTAELAAEARALDLQLLPWTVNEPVEMARLIDLGVDGLITDYPDRLRKVLAAKQIPLPPPSR